MQAVIDILASDKNNAKAIVNLLVISGMNFCKLVIDLNCLNICPASCVKFFALNFTRPEWIQDSAI